jgi:outer membrane protein assembly factor BamA
MLLPKLVERTLTNAMKLQAFSAVDLRRREVRDAFVVMSIVVPIKSKRTPVLPLVESHTCPMD